MRTINYTEKKTAAATIYLDINADDKQYLLNLLKRQVCFMAELALSKDATAKQATQWFRASDKTLPYSTRFKRHNSPESFFSGLINNMEYGSQRDITDPQREQITNMVNGINAIQKLFRTDMKLDIQPNVELEDIEFNHQLFHFGK
jgi:hypothetical protein